jgi:NTE family protein
MIRQNSILMAKLMKPDMLVDIQMSRYGTFDFDKSEKLIAIGQQKTAQAISKLESGNQNV